MPSRKLAGATARTIARRRAPSKTAPTRTDASECERVTPWGAITVRSGRPLGYTADLKAHIRQRFEDTPESEYSIATDLGVHHFSLERLAKREGWVRRHPPPQRDITPMMRIAAEADALAASPPPGGGSNRRPSSAILGAKNADAEHRLCAQRSGGGGSRSEDHPTAALTDARADPPPQGEGDTERGEGGTAFAAPNPPDTAAIARLEAAVLKELSTVETMRASLGAEPLRPADAERTARTLSVLTETLAKLRRLRLGSTPQADDHDDDSADIDDVRRDLARRIDAFVASRADGAGAGGAGDGADAPAL